MANYFTPNGPKLGPWRYRDSKYAGAVGVHPSHEPGFPIGMALGVRWTDDGVATWKLTVNGVQLEGLWIVVDREFRPSQ